MPDFDAAFELLPADGPDITPDDALAAALEDAADEAIAGLRPLGRGWAFDFETTHQFVTYGGEPAGVNGLANLRAWIEKALRTARFAHPVYSGAFGIDVVDLYGRAASPDLFAEYASAVIDALLAHDRISAVTDFRFNYDPMDDAVEVGFTVVVDEGENATTLTFDPIPLGG